MRFLKTAILIHPLERSPDLQLRTKPGHRIDASTLGEAIAVAESMLEVKIVPERSSLRSYPFYRMEGIPERKPMPVVVIIVRGAETIYPGHNVAFPLLESDTVGIGGTCD